MSADLFILNSFGQQKNKDIYLKNLSDIRCDKCVIDVGLPVFP